jgi:hypothetical protein
VSSAITSEPNSGEKLTVADGWNLSEAARRDTETGNVRIGLKDFFTRLNEEPRARAFLLIW